MHARHACTAVIDKTTLDMRGEEKRGGGGVVGRQIRRRVSVGSFTRRARARMHARTETRLSDCTRVDYHSAPTRRALITVLYDDL